MNIKKVGGNIIITTCEGVKYPKCDRCSECDKSMYFWTCKGCGTKYTASKFSVGDTLKDGAKLERSFFVHLTDSQLEDFKKTQSFPKEVKPIKESESLQI